jgi:hypothetical protein
MKVRQVISEAIYNRQFVTKQVPKLAGYAQERGVSLDTLLSKLEACDPTPKKTYTHWIALQLVSGYFNIEDVDRMRNALTEYDRIKHRLPLEQRNISRLKFVDLEDIVEKLVNPELGSNTGTFKIPNEGANVLYNGPQGLLVIPETEKAARILGSGTRWCTSGNNGQLFHYYSNQAPLYIWRDRSGDKFQFHFYIDTLITSKYSREPYSILQLRDARDQSLPVEVVRDFAYKHPVLSKLFNHEEQLILNGQYKRGDSRDLTPAMIAAQWAHQIRGQRWPEAEPLIIKDPTAFAFYVKFVGQPDEAAFDSALSDPVKALNIVRKVIKKPWPKFEQLLKNPPPEWQQSYTERALKNISIDYSNWVAVNR